ncbi:17317_t:CDS:2 [Entrophospora sp. SA101]|nr:17317_t:CDS:2 [Entrophospora sp. SA101]
MNKDLKILALGGLHEVGKNCYVIEKKEDLIIIDCGIKFLNNGYNLANGIIPNFAYLKSNKERIKGLFITHGHEDHIGGIPYLLEEIGYDFPVYGSAFALALLKGKLGNKENLLKAAVGKKGVDLLLSDSTNAEVPGTTPTERKIVSRDTVILTSSPIMDNRYNLEAINNKLMELGATIYENNKEELLHASGHACQEDLKLMLTLTKPRYFMPFHGDFRMLKVHGSLAQETGVPADNIFVCQNGEVIQAREEEKEPSQFFFTNQKIDTTPHYVFNQKIIQGDW